MCGYAYDESHPKLPISISLSRTGQAVVAGRAGGGVRVWNSVTGSITMSRFSAEFVIAGANDSSATIPGLDANVPGFGRLGNLLSDEQAAEVAKGMRQFREMMAQQDVSRLTCRIREPGLRH